MLGTRVFMNRALLATAAVALTSSSFATLIDFESLTTGTTLSNQFSDVTFSSGIGGATGITAPSGNFATATDLTIVSSTGSDVGGLGSPAGTVSGNIVRSFNGWLNEDGDAAVTLLFTGNVSDISVAFAGVSTSSSTRLFAIASDNTVASSAVASTTGQMTLSLTGLTGINKFVITSGDFFDWVGFDNVNYTMSNPVPEPASMAALGFGALALLRRRKRK